MSHISAIAHFVRLTLQPHMQAWLGLDIVLTLVKSILVSGILLLGELLEFIPGVLDVLHQPIEDKVATIR